MTFSLEYGLVQYPRYGTSAFDGLGAFEASMRPRPKSQALSAVAATAVVGTGLK